MRTRSSGISVVAILALALAGAGGAARAEEAPAPSVTAVPEAVPAVPPEAPVYLVAEPVVDLRREPRPVSPDAVLKRPYDMDPFEESQLLYCEEVKFVEESGPWARVEAVEQSEYTHHRRWEGYPGWVLKRSLTPKPDSFRANAVVVTRYARLYATGPKKGEFLEIPLGARLQVLDKDKAWARVARPGQGDGWVKLKEIRSFTDIPRGDEALRKNILRVGKLFLREPYYWGGRCSFRVDTVDRPTGVDCSALVNLAYRANGLDVPRDAHEQYLRSRPVMPHDLRPGDLIFLAKTNNPNYIVHALILVGEDQVLEAVHEFDTVRLTTVENKLGKPLREIGPLEPVNDRYLYLGRLVPDEGSLLLP